MNPLFILAMILLFYLNAIPYIIIISAIILIQFFIMGSRKFDSSLSFSIYDNPNESNSYLFYNWNCKKAFEFINKKKNEGYSNLTLTIYLGIALARALGKNNVLNGKIPLGNFLHEESIDVDFLVALDKGDNIGDIIIRNANLKTISEVGKELSIVASPLKKNRNPEYLKQTKSIEILPTFIYNLLVYFLEYLSSYFNFSNKSLWLRKRHFGSIVVTSIGGLGYLNIIPPINPIIHCPFLVALNKAIDQPIVSNEGNSIEINKSAQVSITFDCRYMNINGLKGFYNDLDFYLNSPEILETGK